MPHVTYLALRIGRAMFPAALRHRAHALTVSYQSYCQRYHVRPVAYDVPRGVPQGRHRVYDASARGAQRISCSEYAARPIGSVTYIYTYTQIRDLHSVCVVPCFIVSIVQNLEFRVYGFGFRV